MCWIPFAVAGGAAGRENLRAGFNPIEAMRLDHNLVADGALIADALVVGAGKDPHWDESAKAFIEGVILHLKTWPDYQGRRNLLTLARARRARRCRSYRQSAVRLLPYRPRR